MDQKKLDQQSQHWELSFSNKPKMFGSAPSLAAEKALKIFKKENIKNIVELGPGLGRDTIFFAKNSIFVNALDYSSSAVRIINDKISLNYQSKKHFNEGKIDFSSSEMSLLGSLSDEGIKFTQDNWKKIILYAEKDANLTARLAWKVVHNFE